MATSNNTKATQTEEDEADCLHLTAKNINFKCPEGITSKLETFEVIPKWGFHIGVKLDGIRYHGIFLETIDSSEPINYVTTKRRRSTFSKKNKTRPSVVTRTKKPNVFSRENFPKGYIDTYNTIEARLRYGRDKKIPALNSAATPGDAPSQSEGDSVLKSNRKKKSQSVVAGSPSNADSSTCAKSNRKKKSQSVVAGSPSNTDSSTSAKRNRKKKSQSVVAGSPSNTDSSTSAKSNRKKKSQSVVAGSPSNTDSSTSAKSNQKMKLWNIIDILASNTDSSTSAKSNRKKKSQSVVTGSPSNTDSSTSAKSNQKMKLWNIIDILASNTDSSISAKSNRKKKSWSDVEGSPSNTDSSISAKSNRKKKSWSIIEESTSNTDSSISSNVFEKTSSSPCSVSISYGENEGEMNAATNDTSFCSPATKMTSKNAERQTKVYFLRSLKRMKGQPRDLNSGLGCMVSTPRTDTDALSMNIDDTLQSVTSNQDSLSRISEPDLIVFSPEINTEKQCRKGYESVGNVSTSSQVSEPDLISFSPEINNETNFKTKIIERPSVIKRTGLNLLLRPLSLSPPSKVSCKKSETVSSQFSPEKLVYKPEKFGDIQYIEDGDNVLNTNEKSAKQSTESKLQNTIGMKDVSINILNKITLNKGNSSSESKLHYKSNADEIQGMNSSFEIKTWNEFSQHGKRSENHEEIIGVNSNIDSVGNFHLEFESSEKNNTGDQTNKQISARDMPPSSQYISQNNQKAGLIQPRSDKTKKNTVMKMNPQLSESRFSENPEVQNDNTNLKEISRQFPFDICFKRETSNSSKNKENEFDISEKANQS